MVKSLILGGTGFIGFHLARHLVEATSHEITLVDNLSRGPLDQDMQELLGDAPQLKLIARDLTNVDSFRNLGDAYDRVYLLAGIVGVANTESNPVTVLHTNTTIILNTLEWLRHVGCGRLMFASSSETYAGGVDLGITQVPTAENVPVVVSDILHPRSTYAITKLVGEAAVTHYSEAFGFESVVVRYHNVYGPRMGLNHVIPELIQRITQAADPFPVYSVDQTRAFCYVSDAVEATYALMTCPIDGTELVHVGNGNEETTIGDLLDQLLNIAGFHPQIQFLPAPVGSVQRRCPDVSKLKSLTGFEAKVGLDQGLKSTFDWYERQFTPTVGSRERRT